MKFLIALAFFISAMTSYSQSEVILNDGCKKAYQEILSLRFNQAREILETERARNQDNVYVDYLENYIDFLSLFISEDESLFKKLEKNKSKRIDLTKKIDNESPYRNYLIGNIHLQWAVARLKFKEYITAAYEINRAYRLLKSNSEKFPDFIPNNITLGVLHIMIGLVPDKYHWILDIINMEGSVEAGKKELNIVLKNTRDKQEYAYLKNEVLFYLGFVELNIYPDETELNFLLSQLEDAEKDNLMLSYLIINILMRTGNNDEVLRKFNQLPEMESYYPFYYLNYLEADCHFRKLDANEAKNQYNFFLENFTGQNFIKDAYRKLAWIALLNNDTLQYRDIMIGLPDNGQTNVGQDIDAAQEADFAQIPNADLIISRLLFDGGYFHQSDSVLNKLEQASLVENDLLELKYRKARIAHQHGNFEIAKLFYNETIDMGENSTRYFAGNSALKLGEIYENEAEFEQAKYYYTLCLDLEFDEFESGIHSKAKAGLKRVPE